jgi:hypothetical protein
VQVVRGWCAVAVPHSLRRRERLIERSRECAQATNVVEFAGRATARLVRKPYAGSTRQRNAERMCAQSGYPLRSSSERGAGEGGVWISAPPAEQSTVRARSESQAARRSQRVTSASTAPADRRSTLAAPRRFWPGPRAFSPSGRRGARGRPRACGTRGSCAGEC